MNPRMARGLTAALVAGSLFGGSGFVWADKLAAVGPAAAHPSVVHQSIDPAAWLRETTEQLLAELVQDRERLQDPQVRERLVREHVSKHIGFHRIGRRVLGPHWRRASEIQRSRFVHELERMVYRAFADLLLAEEGVRIDFGQVRGKPKSGRATVRSTLHTKARKPLDIRFRLHNAPSGWKLYDVVVEGVSLVTTYRAAFNVTVKQHGLDGLIDSLVVKNQALGQREQS